MEENKIKRLPMMKPLITSYTPVASLFSILACSEKTKNWIFCNYINMEAYNYALHNGVCFVMTPNWLATKYCPFIVESILPRNSYKSFCNSITEYLIKWIDLEQYIYLVADGSQFEGCFTKEYYNHDIFISGYDMEKRVFFVHDFIFDGLYKCVEIPFEQMERAYENVNPEDDYINESYGGITLWKYNDTAEYSLNMKLIRQELYNYLNAVNVHTRENFTRDEVRNKDLYRNQMYGIRVYEFIRNMLKEKDMYVISVVHDFYDHKLLMVERLKYLRDKFDNAGFESYIADYVQLREKMNTCCMLLIKYETVERQSYADKVFEILDECERQEKETLSGLLSFLCELE